MKRGSDLLNLHRCQSVDLRPLSSFYHDGNVPICKILPDCFEGGLGKFGDNRDFRVVLARCRVTDGLIILSGCLPSDHLQVGI